MTELSCRSTFSGLFAPVREPRIVLATLTPLRWLAVIGQLSATAVAIAILQLKLPLAPIAAVIGLTAASNVILMSWMRVGRTPAWLVPGTLLMDILSLTALLYLTGGPNNPFAILYLIHVAMAVSVLGTGWTWIVVATAAACYAALLEWHLPFVASAGDRPLPQWAWDIGSWLALALVAVLIAVFIGRVTWDLRQREHELVAMRERASKSEQLAALTTLAAGAAHELNTPLGTIAVVAKELELSCSAPGGDESAAEDARLIRRQVDRCRHILSRMRFDIGEEVSHRTQVRMDDFVARLRQDLHESEQARLVVSRSPDVNVIRAPSVALEQSLLVLLRNAFDASPEAQMVNLEIARRNGSIRFQVKDAGCGMSEEMLRRAGEPFYTTKEPGKGMGLGLFLVRLVAERCGAEFTMQSRLGEGTICAFELPEAEDDHDSRR